MTSSNQLAFAPARYALLGVWLFDRWGIGVRICALQALGIAAGAKYRVLALRDHAAEQGVRHVYRLAPIPTPAP